MMPWRWILLVAALPGCLGGCGGGKAQAPEPAFQADYELGAARPEVPFSGSIAFQSDLDGDNEIYLLTSAGLRKLTDNAWDDRYPRWSPDGKKIAYSANPAGNFDLFVMNAGGSEARPITRSPEDELDVAWTPDGASLVFSRRPPGGDEASWSIDLATGRIEEAVRGFRRSHGFAEVSPATRAVAFTGHRRLGGWAVYLFDPRDESVRELAARGGACRARFSPDGNRLAFVSSDGDGKGEIWTMKADGGGQARLADRSETYDYFPSWSPDGTRIVFCSNARDKYAHKGDWALWVVGADGGPAARLLDTPGRDVFPDWR